MEKIKSSSVTQAMGEGINNVEQVTKEDIVNAVTGVETIVNKASDDIIDALKDEMNKVSENQAQQVNANVEKLSSGQNIVLEAVDEMVNFMKEEVTTANENAKKHERISYQVRGQLGAEVRKQRKVDADEIATLKRKNEELVHKNELLMKFIVEKYKDNAALNAKVTNMESTLAAQTTDITAIKSMLGKFVNKKSRV